MKNNKKKIKFNIIDFIAVFLIVASFCMTAVFFFLGKGLFTQNSVEVEYVISIDYLPTEFVNNISVDTEIFDQNSSFSLGRVTYIDLSFITDEYTTMKLYVAAKAEDEHGVLYINGIPLKNGTQIAFRTPDLMYDGVCTSVIRKVVD